jgi:hypothetical protein
MAKYRVRDGYTYGAFGTYHGGDIVELPEQDAEAFLDKLELAPSEVPDSPAIPDDVEEPEADVVTLEMPAEPVEVPAEPEAVKPRRVPPARGKATHG